MTKSPHSVTPRSRPKPTVWPILMILFGLPAALMGAKLPGLPSAEFFSAHVSLAALPEPLQDKLADTLLVPLGALLVVFVRLTLGLRVLGPFRSILLAVAFQITGAVLGLVFLAGTVAVVVCVRPTIKALRMPYFGRITVMLSTVAVLMIVAVMAGDWLHFDRLQSIAYFPIVVLCLVADAFARTLNSEGVRSALWRGTMTVLVAVVLALLAGVPAISNLLIRYPELLVMQIGGIIVVARLMPWRLLERLNPRVLDDEEDEFEQEEPLDGEKQQALLKNKSESRDVRLTAR